jgi:hypothetical protein
MESQNESNNLITKNDTKKKTKKSKSEAVIEKKVDIIEEKQVIENPIAVASSASNAESEVEEAAAESEIDEVKEDSFNQFFKDINIETVSADFDETFTLINKLLENIKNIDPTVDSIKKINKKNKQLRKVIENLQNIITDVQEKSFIASSKNSKKKSSKKSADNVDKKPSAVTIPKEPMSFVRSFMKIDDSELISSTNVLQAISKYVTSERDSKNKDIDVWITEKEDKKDKKEKKASGDKSPVKIIKLSEPEIDKTQFKIIGELIPLFENIKKEMTVRGVSVENFPNSLKYTDIMRYLPYCFPPKAK